MADVVRRIGLLGDVHGDSLRLQMALVALRDHSDLDAIVSVGDIVNLDADTEACCRLLQEAGAVAVRGNHDRWFLQNLALYSPEDERPGSVSLQSRAFIASLPMTRDIETAAGRAMLCHGIGEDDMAGVYGANTAVFPQAALALWKLEVQGSCRWVLNGHTHRRMVRPVDGLTIINAGTVCKDPQSGFAIVDFAKRQVQFFDIDDELAVHPAEHVELS